MEKSDFMTPHDIEGLDVLQLGGRKVDISTLENSERLSLIVRHGVGYDKVDVDACTKNRISSVLASAKASGASIETSNKFPLAPPPGNLLTNSSTLKAIFILLYYPATSLKSTPVLTATKFSRMKLIDLAGLIYMSPTNSFLSITLAVLFDESQTT